MNKKVTLSLLSATVFASMAASAFAAPTQGVYMGGSVDKFYKLDDLFNLTAEAKKQFVTNLNTANPGLDFKNLVFVDFDGKGAKFSEILAAGTLPKAKRDLTKADFEGSYVTVNLDGSNGASYDPRNDAVDVPTGDLKVESVSAINASQIQIVFSDVVDETSAIAAGNVTFDGFTANTRELQEDGKTLIVTTNTPIKVKTDVVVTVKGVKLDADNNKVVPTFTKVISVEDTVKPEVASIVAKTNGASASTATVTFTEPVKAAAVIKIDGVVAGATQAGSKVTLSNLNLDATKTHTLEIVNLTDTADNVTPLVTKTFTVTTDVNAPQVSSLAAKGDHQILVTFNKPVTLASVQAAVGNKIKDELLADVNVDTIKVATPGATTSDTQFIIPVKDKLFTTATSRTLTVVFNKDIVDTLGNKSEAVTKTVTLTKDVTAPAITSIQAKKAADGKTEAIVVNFSEGVLAQAAGFDVAKIRVLAPNGTDATTNFFATAQPAIAEGATKATVNLKVATQLSGVYTFIIAKDAVSDLAETANTSAAFTSTVDFGAAPTGEFKIDPSDVTSSKNKNNTITVNYKQVVKGGAVAGSATDVNNYTLGGKALPQGTIITLSADQKQAIIDLPHTESVATSDKAIFTISGVQNVAGTTISPVTTTVDVVDNVAPVLESAKVLDNKTIELTYSENIAALTNADVFDSFKIVNGTTAIPLATGELVADSVSGFGKKVKVTIKQGADRAGTPASATAGGAASAKVTIANGTAATKDATLSYTVVDNNGTLEVQDGSNAVVATLTAGAGSFVVDGVTVTLAGAVAADAFTVTTKAAVAGTSATTLDLNKAITVETKATTAVKDIAGNVQKVDVKVDVK
ncbi:hypothetical protein [Brevibacillus agri]|uniref:hypothetical protein n=1 Tax=Brevibacillus agri TaxID=51101 RepID=UPI003D1CF216